MFFDIREMGNGLVGECWGSVDGECDLFEWFSILGKWGMAWLMGVEVL